MREKMTKKWRKKCNKKNWCENPLNFVGNVFVHTNRALVRRSLGSMQNDCLSINWKLFVN